MNTLPHIIPISDLRIRHNEVLDLLKQGKIILAQRSRPIAVLLSIADWEDQAEYIDKLECAVAALKVELALAKGETDLIELTPAEINEWLTADEAEAAAVPA